MQQRLSGCIFRFFEKRKPLKPQSKAETLKQLRIERYEAREARAKASAAANTPMQKD